MLLSRTRTCPRLIANISARYNASDCGGAQSKPGTKRGHLLDGVLAPIPTPFVEIEKSGDGGVIDFQSLRENLKHWANRTESGLDGIVVMGSNGEFPLLRTTEKIYLLQQVVSCAEEIHSQTKKKQTMIAGVGEIGTRNTIEMVNIAHEIKYDAALIVTPYYYTTYLTADEDRLYKHYMTVADHSKIPIVLYSMPGFAGGVSISSTLAEKLSLHPNIIGMKDSSGSLENLQELVQRTKRKAESTSTNTKFSVLAGSANYFLPALHSGATGGIMATANVYGKHLQYIYQNHRTTDEKEKRKVDKLQLSLVSINQTITRKYSVPGLKFALDNKSLYGGPTRLPLLPLDHKAKQEIIECLKQTDQALSEEKI